MTYDMIMSTDIPHLRFLPDGSYDLSTPERRLAAAESLLATIAVMPRIYSSDSPSENRDEMARQAANMALNLRQAREQETARCAIGVDELQLSESQLRDLLWIEGLLADSREPLTVAGVESVVDVNTRQHSMRTLRLAVRNAALRAVRIDTSAARPIHTADNLGNLTYEQIVESGCDERTCFIATAHPGEFAGDEPITEAMIVEACEQVARGLNEQRLLAVVDQ